MERDTYSKTNFKDIKEIEVLVDYLDSNDRLNNGKFLYHYTSFSNAVKIIKGKKWHLASPKGMNDQLEYENGDKWRWNNLFFNCFMLESKESIGMWSMYSQPWERGVKIAIPRRIFVQWVKGIEQVHEVSMNDFGLTGRSVHVGEDKLRVWISSVAYSNHNSLEKPKDNEKIMWSNVTNTNIRCMPLHPELTGYIKDYSWAYEKEVRIKAEFENYYGFERVAIDIPENVIDSFIITASPLFEGNLSKMLIEETERELKVEKSLFTNKLKIKNVCDDCVHKKY